MFLCLSTYIFVFDLIALWCGGYAQNTTLSHEPLHLAPIVLYYYAGILFSFI